MRKWTDSCGDSKVKKVKLFSPFMHNVSEGKVESVLKILLLKLFA